MVEGMIHRYWTTKGCWTVPSHAFWGLPILHHRWGLPICKVHAERERERQLICFQLAPPLCVCYNHALHNWPRVGLEARGSQIPFPPLGYKFLHRWGELRLPCPFLLLQNRDCVNMHLESNEKQEVPTYSM